MQIIFTFYEIEKEGQTNYWHPTTKATGPRPTCSERSRRSACCQHPSSAVSHLHSWTCGRRPTPIRNDPRQLGWDSMKLTPPSPKSNLHDRVSRRPQAVLRLFYWPYFVYSYLSMLNIIREKLFISDVIYNQSLD